MPDEYIKRSDARAYVRHAYVKGLNLLLAYIDVIPAADVEPVRHGRWIQSDLDAEYVTCSECKRMKLQNRMAWNLNTADHWGLHYCPNCGAKMDGKTQKEGDDGEEI